MYIDRFIAGILFTIAVEITLVLIYAFSKKRSK